MTLKCTALFTQSTNLSGGSRGLVRVGGWSETWYSNQAITETRNEFETLCQIRALMLPNSAAVIGQRYQIVGGGSSTSGRVFPGAGGQPADVPQMALMCTMKAAGVPNIRRFALRGIPDAIVVEGEYKPTGAFTTALNRYSTQITDGQFLMRGRNLSTAPFGVVSVDVNGNVVLTAAQTITVGSEMQFVRTTDQYGRTVSGSYFVETVTDTTHFKLHAYTFGVVNGGQIRLLTAPGFLAMEIGSLVPVRVVVRKVGRPFGGYRGRASNRR
jgi:hypothetical protein